MESFQPIGAIATTPAGVQQLASLCQSYQLSLWVPERIAEPAAEVLSLCSGQDVDGPDGLLTPYSGSLAHHLAHHWSQYRSWIFCLATGAVVRLVAPLLQDKATDPAVVVVDEAGKYVISLCGGHQGGADQLTQLVAHHLGATPVLTGAANGAQLPGLDVIGQPFGWTRGSGDWTGISAAAAREAAVQVIQEAGSTLWREHLPTHHPFQLGWQESGSAPASPPQARLWISPIQRKFSPDSDIPKAQWHPRVLWVGVGCERGTSRTLIEMAIERVCRLNHLAVGAIAGIATLDLKADEVGLVELCQARNWPLQCFSAADLKTILVPSPSEVVKAAVGTPSVAEAAALRAVAEMDAADGGPVGLDSNETDSHKLDSAGINSDSNELDSAEINSDSNELDSAEIGLDQHGTSLRVQKQVIRQADQPGAVTVAIAQASQEYTGRPGKLLLVGTGPGQLDQITPAAQAAISGADAVIGYALYIDLIRPLFRPGQIIEPWPITQERQRAQRAIKLAQWGLTVAVVSSGDCGIYGMAGLVLEMLQGPATQSTLDLDIPSDADPVEEIGLNSNQTPAFQPLTSALSVPDIQVLPGITALQAAAARVGAPLMHDFCAISLSDLLTPWTVIQQRLVAAAQADFVVALYNPRSQQRQSHIEVAQRIFLEHRSSEVPVAIVKAAYRPEEQVRLATLGTLLHQPIDMLTVVLIGNKSTRFQGKWMVTPRGYDVQEP